VRLIEDDDELWNRFLRRGLPAELAHGADEVVSLYTAEKLYRLGRTLAPGPTIEPGVLPLLDFAAVLDYVPEGLHASTKRSITTAQDRLRQWNDAWQRGDRHRPPPKAPDSNKAAEFIAQWVAAFRSAACVGPRSRPGLRPPHRERLRAVPAVRGGDDL